MCTIMQNLTPIGGTVAVIAYQFPENKKKQKPNLVSGIKHTSVASAGQKYTANLLIRRYSA